MLGTIIKTHPIIQFLRLFFMIAVKSLSQTSFRCSTPLRFQYRKVVISMGGAPSTTNSKPDAEHQITLYTSSTPNGYKASIVLEELELPYKVHYIHLSKNEQKEDWYLKINPNGRIPAIVDHNNKDFPVFESGALMIYLCEKYDNEKKLMPTDEAGKYEVLQWIMWQMGGLGPMQGQAHHFMRYAPQKIEYGQKRYVNETKRLYGVLENRLQSHPYLAGDQYSIADISCFTWVVSAPWATIDLNEFPKVKAWMEKILARPAVQRGMDVPEKNTFLEMIQDPEKIKKAIQDAQAMMTKV
eukprot:TRINITY_DN1173_c0_g2_i2.p1 TRINITY_DN1173_c0_g2~~TRINITY_DN1173_c0_g2_i2.p1  ORF type:complete len:298 (+),score=36.09 TRINITY_DN1173_c0_g2_i2:2-895(+)